MSFNGGSMLRRYLSGYDSFICAADKCPDTCCGGWEIEIDEDSIELYKSLKENGEKIFAQNVDFENEIFNLKPNGECSCLLPDGLCALQKKYGEEYLCHTCDSYPRHVEEFPNVREYIISVSCPIGAKNLLFDEKEISFTENNDTEEDEYEYEDFNYELYDTLVDFRKKLLQIMDNKEIPLRARLISVLNLSAKLQEKIDEGFYPKVSDIEDEDFVDWKDEDWFEFVKAHIDFLFEIEPLSDEFTQEKKRAKENLLSDLTKFYTLEKEFEEKTKDWDKLCEKICKYFIYSYFCGGVYDDYIYSAGKQAVYNTIMIKLLWCNRYAQNKNIDKEDLAEILYKYSRELENCKENLILLNKLLDEL